MKYRWLRQSPFGGCACYAVTTKTMSSET